MGVQGIPRSTLLGSPRTHSVQLGLLFWLVCSLFCYHSTSFFLKIFLATPRLACGILVPQPGTEPMPPVIGVQPLDRQGIPHYAILVLGVLFGG